MLPVAWSHGTSTGVWDHQIGESRETCQAMLLMEELFFIPFWGIPVMAARSSGMTGVSFLCMLASRESCTMPARITLHPSQFHRADCYPILEIRLQWRTGNTH